MAVVSNQMQKECIYSAEGSGGLSLGWLFWEGAESREQPESQTFGWKAWTQAWMSIPCSDFASIVKVPTHLLKIGGGGGGGGLVAKRVWLFCDPVDCSPPGSSVRGFPGNNTGVGCHFFSRGSSQPRDGIWVSHIAGRFFTIWATREAPRILEWFASRFFRGGRAFPTQGSTIFW